jgi:hypothetical protein
MNPVDIGGAEYGTVWRDDGGAQPPLGYATPTEGIRLA